MAASSTYGGGAGGPNRGGKMLQVKNKSAAPIQITAEQLLREAVDRQAAEVTAPRQRIMDEEELAQYRVRKRKEFEDLLRRSRHYIGNWIKYALWEATQREFRRARSVFERAMGVDYQNTTLWMKYIEMEMTNKFINAARNLYDRVTQLLPRVDQFWFKYAHMEELIGNYVGARAVFDRWMEWEPEDNAWLMYVKFEERCKELQRARIVFERYISCRPSQESFLRFSKFEERHRNFERARGGFEKAIEVMPPDSLDQKFYIKFAQFELQHREIDRANAVFKAALSQLPKAAADELYTAFVSFQKQYAERSELEETVLNKRRFMYEEKLKLNPTDYDAWFDYIRLEEEDSKDANRVRDIYERAVGCLPPIAEKKYWERYIYFWMNYALYEEIQTENVERCRAVYDQVLNVVPHKIFSFSKLWRYYAEFEVRQLNLDRARKIYGRAIGECGKRSIFTSYANLELRLGNIDRCRKIYAKFIEFYPLNPKAWIALVEMEVMAEELDRARAICEIATEIEDMDLPELIWKCYIDTEIQSDQIPRARALFERLLAKTQHYKVYKSYAEFEHSIADEIDKARKVLQRGLEVCKDSQLEEDRKLLLECWLQLEKEGGDEQMVQSVWSKQPKKVKKKRNIVGEDGTAQGWEEYTAYIFPEDTAQTSNLKILEAAKNWKRARILLDV